MSNLRDVNYRREYDMFAEKTDDKVMGWWLKYVLPSCALICLITAPQLLLHPGYAPTNAQLFVISWGVVGLLPMTPLVFLISLPYVLLRDWYFQQLWEMIVVGEIHVIDNGVMV